MTKVKFVPALSKVAIDVQKNGVEADAYARLKARVREDYLSEKLMLRTQLPQALG